MKELEKKRLEKTIQSLQIKLEGSRLDKNILIALEKDWDILEAERDKLKELLSIANGWAELCNTQEKELQTLKEAVREFIFAKKGNDSWEERFDKLKELIK